jgi:hypothetical protein
MQYISIFFLHILLIHIHTFGIQDSFDHSLEIILNILAIKELDSFTL